MLNIDNLTLGEAAKVEELSGLPITALGDPNAPKILPMTALFFVMKRREDRSFTWEQAKNSTFAEMQEFLGVEEDDSEDPGNS